MRNTDDDANIDIDLIDLASKTICIYNNLPEVDHVASLGSTVYRMWPVEIKILRLASLDDDGDDGDILREICLQAADIIYDQLSLSDQIYPPVPIAKSST